MTMIRIGIDVGGTNTDAVVMEGDRVNSSFKATTSPDVTAGVSEALVGALRRSHVIAHRCGGARNHPFQQCVVPRRDLTPTAAVRLGLPETQALRLGESRVHQGPVVWVRKKR